MTEHLQFVQFPPLHYTTPHTNTHFAPSFGLGGAPAGPQRDLFTGCVITNIRMCSVFGVNINAIESLSGVFPSAVHMVTELT